ncbi:ATP-dependent Clp protease proteolytic subunit [Rhizobium oryzicola]|uniref:ATP-dependent Clp protease proteolytic subunit n=1 Tax=Rhizobium oryzicola TaxID=1232668 RepID=A0ABT8ST37_9HYPH|nr:ATP-dependent Clp protease proteolytic subunit [Rhizobium oryzicola]MDO1580882.1 ATP-dependent Clp protease proteolytic subunit [Rhizobium oryzicola]
MAEHKIGGLLSSTILPKKEVWMVFAGMINQDSVRSIFSMFSTATQDGFTDIHCLFQSSGGVVGDGVALYNFFKTMPITVRLYNVGSICSIGVIAYLGAPNRVAAQSSTFMIHRAQSAALSLTSERMTAAANSLVIDDARMEAILKAEIALPETHWETHKVADLWLDAEEGLDAGLITEIAPFAPPKGERIFFI